MVKLERYDDKPDPIIKFDRSIIDDQQKTIPIMIFKSFG